MKRIRLLAASAIVALSLAGCGGGGTESSSPITGTETVISGMATKGPITGTVNIYALGADGAKGSLLKSAPISNGSYSASVGTYEGPVLVEATGNYTDEATGQTLSVGSDAPLRAAVSNASGTVAVPVTPLTDLAVREAGELTASGIDNGNRLISDIFGFDIIKTQPVAPSPASLAAATQSQKDYTLALATLSQLSKDMGMGLEQTLSNVAVGIGATGMDSNTATIFRSAAVSFITANTNNSTGINDLSQTNVAEITGKIASTASYTLTIEGAPSAGAVKGIQFELLIPDGLTVRHNSASGVPLPGIVTESAQVTGAASYIEKKFSISTGVGVLNFALMTTAGIGSGDLATLVCDTVAGYAVPTASGFRIRNLKAVDDNGVTIGSVTVTVR